MGKADPGPRGGGPSAGGPRRGDGGWPAALRVPVQAMAWVRVSGESHRSFLLALRGALFLLRGSPTAPLALTHAAGSG